MRKKLLLSTLSIVMACSLIVVGCRNQVEKTVNTSSDTNSRSINLTLDEIKKKYMDTKIKSTQNIGKDFALVESQQDTFANKFDIYNLRTGDMDTLPTMPEFVTLEKVVNENYFIFLSSGKNSESPFGAFPHYISCIRIKNDDYKDDDFINLSNDKYFNFDYSVQAGSKEGTLMANMNVGFDGLEVLFEPVKGEELKFYADATDIPPTKVIYNKDKRQIVLEIGTNQLSEKLNKMKKVNIDNNQFMSSFEITQKDNKTYLAVTISDLVKTYSIKTKKLPNQLPYFNIVFSNKAE